MKNQRTKATTTAPAATLLADENRLYTNLMQNGNADLYDSLTLQLEQLDHLTTLVGNAKEKLLAETGKHDLLDVKNLLGIAEYLIDNYHNSTQKHVDRISQPTTSTKQ